MELKLKHFVKNEYIIGNNKQIHLHLLIMCCAPLEHTRSVAIYRHVTRGSSPCLELVNNSCLQVPLMIFLKDSRDWALTVSVGRLFNNLIPDEKKASL